ncbi:hypothetical protein TRVA0_020S01332 [Trichomonascus vanleenenianus]|uniref:Mud1p n=1 Tax=Trichomonascus vanleenenianus TaxID=2268995 RepID=UPI003ECA2A23
MSDLAPSETLYIRNINEKIKLDRLKQELQYIFSKYGRIVDIVAHKNLWMRGQAFVVFDDVSSAQKARNEMNEHEIFGKPMTIQFSKTKSDATVMQTSTPEEYEKFKEERLKKKEVRQKQWESKLTKPEPAAKRLKTSKASKDDPTGVNSTLPPNNILFLENVPSTVQQDTLTDVFAGFPGFVEVRLVTIRHVGFVEFDTEEQAANARSNTLGLTQDGSTIRITFAKK